MSAVHKHHRQRRAQGGADDGPNIIELTPEVHELVHRNVEHAYEHGLLVHSYDDPADIVADVPGFLAALERTPVGTGSQGGEEPMQTTVTGEEIPHRHVVNPNGVEKPCPKCKGKGKVIEQEKPEGAEPSPPRPKTTWSVRVPKDERENGYELLESLMESAVEKMADAGLIRDKNKGANYYTLILCLRKFVLGELD